MGFLQDALYVADTPGSLLRGVLAGKPAKRKTGREMLESWGAVGPNQEGLDAGDAAGFLADVVLDPLNLVGGWAAAKGLKAAARAAKGYQTAKGVKMARAAMPIKAATLAEAVGVPAAEKVAPAAAKVSETAAPLVKSAPAAAKPARNWSAWQKDVIAEASPRTGGNQLEIPVLFRQLQAKHPKLTLDEFKKGMLDLHENGDILMQEYTRAPAEIQGIKEVIDFTPKSKIKLPEPMRMFYVRGPYRS